MLETALKLKMLPEEFSTLELNTKPKGYVYRPNTRGGWREIKGKRTYFRSKWEANYARYLEYLKEQRKIESWLYEPEIFIFHEIARGIRSYKPDFKIFEGGKEWFAEVKGYMDSASATKIKRFRKYYPQWNLEIIDRKWFKKNNNLLKNLIKEWE